MEIGPNSAPHRPWPAPRLPSAPFGPNAIIALQGIAARYIGIEILTAEGVTNRVGLAQVEFTQTVADNDPPTLAASAIVDDKSGVPVDVNTKGPIP